MDWFQAAISDDDGLLMDIAGDACTGVPLVERRARPNHEQPLKCPRCESTHTKFCYYNNYNLTQPRYFCKACRRYWTKGGTLRNIPVGGACRKTKKLSSNPKKPDQSQTTTDLHLPFPEQLRFENMGNNVYNNNHQYPFGFLPSFEQGNMGNILESYQRLMLPYDQNNHHEVEDVVKPILSLHDCNSDAGTFEYNLGSWTSLTSGYAGSSATNPLV